MGDGYEYINMSSCCHSTQRATASSADGEQLCLLTTQPPCSASHHAVPATMQPQPTCSPATSWPPPGPEEAHEVHPHARLGHAGARQIEVGVRASKHREADHGAVAHWRLLLHLDVGNLRVTGKHALPAHEGPASVGHQPLRNLHHRWGDAPRCEHGMPCCWSSVNHGARV